MRVVCLLAAGLVLVGGLSLPAHAGPYLDGEEALRWIRSRQGEDGGWSEEGRASDAALTAKCLLAHLAAGWTHRAKGERGDSVERGFRYLKRIQAEDGTWPGGWQSHAEAALAMLEGYGMTESPILKWRSILGWRRLQQAVREEPSFSTDPRLAGAALLCRVGALRFNRWWVRREERRKERPFAGDPPLAPDAAADGVLARWMLMDDGDDALERAVATLARILFDRTEWATSRLAENSVWFREHPPTWDADTPDADPLAWRIGALVAVEFRGDTYKAWREAAGTWASHAVADEGGCSWDPLGLPRFAGGRVALTASLPTTYEILTPCYSLPDSLRPAER